jgi:hypothetical protein
MTMMLLPDLPKGVRPLVTPIGDTADAAFAMSLDCQFLAWGSHAQQLFGSPLPMSLVGIATTCCRHATPQANAHRRER